MRQLDNEQLRSEQLHGRCFGVCEGARNVNHQIPVYEDVNYENIVVQSNFQYDQEEDSNIEFTDDATTNSNVNFILFIYIIFFISIAIFYCILCLVTSNVNNIFCQI